MAKFQPMNKYLVLKWDDIGRFLDQEERERLDDMITKIQNRRIEDGKPPWRDYVVVSNDAPYAGKVWKMVKAEVEAI